VGSTSPFDLAASSFDRYRAWPPGVAEAIRTTIWRLAGKRSGARVLDLGAGTGRIGSAFVEANDRYVGVDLSFAMLRQFRAGGRIARLAQSRGEALPFRDGAFEVVLLMHVLSGPNDHRKLKDEACRVLGPAGVIAVGRTQRPVSGVDARLKRQLGLILQEIGVVSDERESPRDDSLTRLESSAARRSHVTAASWSARLTPREFLARHPTGARFSALPAAVQEQAMQRLTTWAEETFESLDTAFTEEHRFDLDLFEMP
jgi:ubiquinone/menaquinone biosynthesis C-methylase UbiE